MTANSAIETALNQILEAAALGYPVAWPGIDFTPPANGEWLEVIYLPNQGVDDRLADDGYVSPQGIYQVTVASRPQSEIKLREAAEAVQAVFPKGTRISGNIRVGSHPYTSSARIEDDRMRLPVTVEYSE